MSKEPEIESYLVKIKYKSGFEEIRSLPAECVEKMKDKKYNWGELTIIRKLTGKELDEIIELERTCFCMLFEENERGEESGE